jgi:hypothetical protein
MKLKRFLLRYFPPGIILEYESNEETKQKTIDLLDLKVDDDAEMLLNRIMRQEPLIPESKRMYVRKLIYKLIEKQDSQESQQFYLFKILRAHILPLTNCAFNKSGDRFITGSYDRTCKVWNTNTGEELLTLEGHKNVVYAIAFNNPYGDKVITGSFDKTCKVMRRSPPSPARPRPRAPLPPPTARSPTLPPSTHTGAARFPPVVLAGCKSPRRQATGVATPSLMESCTRVCARARVYTGVERSDRRAVPHAAWARDGNCVPFLQSSRNHYRHRVRFVCACACA